MTNVTDHLVIASPSRRYVIQGVDFDLVNYSDVFERIEVWRETNVRSFVAVANPHSVYLCRRDPGMKAALVQAGLIVPDGIGVTIAATLLGHRHSGRIAGPTLVLRLCDWGRTKGYRHFFYGGHPGTAKAMADRLAAAFPGLQVAGCYSPGFKPHTPEEKGEIVALINETCPDIVWVGLGAPKQEKWMAAHLGELECTTMIGIGAAFDFHSGERPWAPRIVRDLGLEWLVRTIQEPRRVGPKALDGARIVLASLLRRSSRDYAGLRANSIASPDSAVTRRG
jgi:N-acetylglucosaminyldiphosphoundecaprenol N-acetyl-beta-D-mannosaminyltransferase